MIDLFETSSGIWEDTTVTIQWNGETVRLTHIQHKTFIAYKKLYDLAFAKINLMMMGLYETPINRLLTQWTYREGYTIIAPNASGHYDLTWFTELTPYYRVPIIWNRNEAILHIEEDDEDIAIIKIFEDGTVIVSDEQGNPWFEDTLSKINNNLL